MTVSPDGSLCAYGLTMLWNLNEGKALSSLEAKGEIHALCFSPNRYWYARAWLRDSANARCLTCLRLCGAVGEVIKIWDLETKGEVVLSDVSDGAGAQKKQEKSGHMTAFVTFECSAEEKRALKALMAKELYVRDTSVVHKKHAYHCAEGRRIGRAAILEQGAQGEE